MSRPTTHLTSVTVTPFLMEAHELIDSILYRLAKLEKLSVEWLRFSARADELGRAHPSAFNHDAFAEALNERGRLHASAFDAVESLLAAWARLSLLFYPLRSAGERGRNRGEVLKQILLPDAANSPLADRDLRNSWMHFDERLDSAIEAGTWGNRHRFTHSSGAEKAASTSLRLIEMDTLKVRFRKADGSPASTDLRLLRPYLLKIEANRGRAVERFGNLFQNDDDDEQPGT